MMSDFTYDMNVSCTLISLQLTITKIYLAHCTVCSYWIIASAECLKCKRNMAIVPKGMKWCSKLNASLEGSLGILSFYLKCTHL